MDLNRLSPWLLAFLCFLPLSYEQLCNYAEDCVTDLSQIDCDKNDQFLILNTTVCNLCPRCESRGEPGRLCTSDANCAPGLKCEGSVCTIDPTNCLSAIHQNKITPLKNMPNCNPDGTWKPVQCKGDRLIGRCFCSSSDGKRIFGMAWARNATEMTCACSRHRYDLESAGRTDVSLHCMQNGNYEPLQCDSGLCWCAEETTGKPTSSVVTQDLVTQLPCFNRDKFGSQYLRKCESKTFAIAVMKMKLSIHGTTEVAFAQPLCDYDGTYGIYQIDNGNAYCSWKDASRIGSWMSVAGAGLADVNCNCARDTKYFEMIGQQMTQTCQGNGNYQALQQLNGFLYCVDEDGYPTTDLMDMGVDLTCD